MTSPAISRAMDAARRRPRVQAVERADVTIRLANPPLRVRKSGDLTLRRTPDADPDDAVFLVYDPRVDAYRPVVLPPGTRWELTEKSSGPMIFLPPGTRR